MSQIPQIPEGAVVVQPSPRTPRRYSSLRAIFLSPFSKDLWQDVGQNWRGVGLLYMFLLLAITWSIVTVKTYVSFASFLDREAPGIVAKIPAVTITNGVVSIDQPEPYIIMESGTQQPIAIIDTTGQTTAPPTPAGLLLTRSTLFLQEKSGQTRTYDLSKVQSFRLDQQQINGWLSTIRAFFIPAMFVLVMTAGILWRLVLMLIGGAIGQVFASMFKAPLSYAATMRLAAIAMTPGILLDTVTGLLGMPGFGCFGFLLGIGLFILFMGLAVNANAPVRPTYQPGFPVLPPPPGMPPQGN